MRVRLFRIFQTWTERIATVSTAQANMSEMPENPDNAERTARIDQDPSRRYGAPMDDDARRLAIRGAKIRAARKHYYLTQAQFAAVIEVARSTVNTWETGKHWPQPELHATLQRIVDGDLVPVFAPGRLAGLVSVDSFEQWLAEVEDARDVKVASDAFRAHLEYVRKLAVAADPDTSQWYEDDTRELPPYLLRPASTPTEIAYRNAGLEPGEPANDPAQHAELMKWLEEVGIRPGLVLPDRATQRDLEVVWQFVSRLPESWRGAPVVGNSLPCGSDFSDPSLAIGTDSGRFSAMKREELARRYKGEVANKPLGYVTYPSQKQRVVEAAKELGVGLAEFVRGAIEERLDRLKESRRA